MLLTGKDPLLKASRRGWALPAFTAYNLETIQGIVTAAERTGKPVLLQAGSSAFRHAGRELLATLALTAARQSPAAVGVHLDHCRDLDEIRACVDAGYTSIMIDGSHLDFADNVALTRKAVRIAHPAGAWVEAELGAISGDEDVSTDAHTGTMTDPDQAESFVAQTGADALAVAVGNVHGFTPHPVQLDLDRLAAIRERVDIPLVLHGASGLPPEQLCGAVARGVAKVNVNAELRRAYLRATEQTLPSALPGTDAVTVWTAAREAVVAAATQVIHILNP